jgi:parafibromin
MKGESPSTLRKSSASREHRSNTSSSLEHELSAFFLRRGRNSKSTANSEFHSSTASPTYKKQISRPVHRSAGDSVKSPSDIEVHLSSVRSSESRASGHPLNVSDWNEQVVKKTRPGSTDSSPTHLIDPPRPPREGHEWVWFPEGYWAEREMSRTSAKSAGSKWLSFSPDRKSRKSSASNHSRGPSKAPTPPKVIFEGSETPSSTTSKSQVPSESGSRDAQGNKILKGLQYLSPVYPHFIAPSGEREGLFCKARRNLGVVPKPKMVRYRDSIIHFFTLRLVAVPN